MIMVGDGIIGTQSIQSASTLPQSTIAAQLLAGSSSSAAAGQPSASAAASNSGASTKTSGAFEARWINGVVAVAALSVSAVAGLLVLL